MSGKVIKEFNGIKFLQSVSCGTASDLSNAPNLHKLFMCIINKSYLEVEQLHLRRILSNDLKIDNIKNRQLLNVLVDALMYYIIWWPGWQRQNEYLNGTLQAEDWFTRFQQYLIFKSRFIIKSAPSFPVHEEKETQTVGFKSSNKQFAPYALCIGAPPYTLNNVVFEERNGNVLLRRCLPKTWKTPSLKELLNWPNICVSLKLLPEISLSRSNMNNIERYMGLCSDTCIPTKAVEHIVHIRKITHPENTMTHIKPYSLEFLTYYAQQLVEVLGMIPGISRKRLEEIKSVLQEFLFDIDEANIHNKTMCSDISVRYHIGRFVYMRKRKVMVASGKRLSKNQNDVAFYEKIVPHMNFSLHHFEGIQDFSDKNGISFVSLNSLKNVLKMQSSTERIESLKNLVNRTCLQYSCTLCEAHKFSSNAQNDILEHLETEHWSEQPVLCHRCCKEYEVKALALNRWRHDCSS